MASRITAASGLPGSRRATDWTGRRAGGHTGAARRRRAVMAACETLEGRQLFAVTVANGSFETPRETTGGGGPTYAYDPTGATWAFAGNAGIERTGSAFNAATAPDGSQAAFLQSSYGTTTGTLGSVSQSLTFPTGTYTVSFYAAARYTTTSGAKVVLPIEFLVDGTQVGGTISPTAATTSPPPFAQFTTSSFTITAAGSHTIKFTGLDNPSVDENVFIDLVTVNTAVAPPTVATAAAASPSTVTGTTSALSVLGASSAGESTLTYTWAATGTPPAAVSFSANGTNAAKSTIVTFAAAGTYTLQATITDANGGTVTSGVVVTVNQTLSGVAVTPASATVYTNGTRQFTAVALDQFGNALATQPTFTWGRTGVGSISASGLYTPGSVTGSATVKALAGGFTSNTVSVSVIAAGTPSITTAAAANPSTVSDKTTTLTVAATDGNGGADLTYAWSLTGTVPAAVAYSANGTSAASTTTATFVAAGTYNFLVTVTSTTGQSTTSSVTVVVGQTATSIAVAPGTAGIAAGGTQQFTATEYDQFGAAMSTQPTFAWSAASGAGAAGSTAIGSVAATTGLYTASATAGTGTVSATAGGLFGTAQVSVGGATIAGGTVTLATFGTNAYYAVDTNSCAIAVDNMWTDAASNDQFAAFYTTGGEIMIARRTVGGSSWQAYDSGVNDSTYTSDDHDVISIAVDSAGYMHVSWGMHNIALNYGISNGVVTGPSLSAVSFTVQTSTTAPTLFALAANDTPGLTSDTNEVTYPQFYAIPNSAKLLFAYRNGGAGGGSGNGDEYIDVYSPATRTWTHTLFIDGEHTSVNAYLNRLTYDSNNNLVATWTWRSTANWQTNSNIMYAQSPDNGTTWYTQGGVNQYALPIIQTDGTNATYSSADPSVAQVVVTIPQGSSFINQASMTVDNSNNPIVASYLAPGTASKNYNLQYMVWYSVNGVWHSSQVTNRTSDTAYDSGGSYVRDLGRPDVLVDGQGRVLVVTRSEDTALGAYSSASTPNNDIVVYFTTTAALDAGTPNWQSVALNTTNMGDYEPTYDQNLWGRSNVLSMFFEPIARSDQSGSNVPVVQSLDWNEQAYFNSAPTVATAAAAGAAPVTGTSTTLSALGADNNGAANLTYTWSTTGTAPAPVTFAANGTNGASSTTATFAAAGTYHFVVTIANAYGYSTTSAVAVTVAQTVTSIAVSPMTASVAQSKTQQFSAVASDQFGTALAAAPTFTWSTDGAGNTVSSAGMFTAGPTATGTATVTATAASVSGSATVNVLVAPTLTLVDNGSATSNATQALSFTATLSGGVPDGATVRLEDASNGNAVLASGVTSGGAVTFSFSAALLTAGAHGLFAAYAGNATYAAAQSTTLTQTEQVVVTAVTVNGNNSALAGGQRSMVDSIVYTFSEAVNIAATGAFAIAVHTGQAGTVPTLAWTALNATDTQWVVTFSGAGVVGGSIANGVYDITMNAAAVTAASNSAVAVQARTTDTFYRLFGDLQGNQTVNSVDKGRFNLAYGTSAGAAAYFAAFDSNGNNTIDTTDKGRFNLDFGLTYSGFTATI